MYLRLSWDLLAGSAQISQLWQVIRRATIASCLPPVKGGITVEEAKERTGCIVAGYTGRAQLFSSNCGP